VTWRAADSRRRAPFDFQPCMSFSGDAKQIFLFILVAPPLFEEVRGGAVPIYTRTGVSRTQAFLLGPYGLVT